MAVAVVRTVGPKLAGLARLRAVPPRPAARAAAQTRHVVAVPVVAAVAAAHAAPPVGAGRARLHAEVAAVAGPALAVAGLVVADPVAGVAERAGLLAAHAVEALRTGLLAPRAREPGCAAAYTALRFARTS